MKQKNFKEILAEFAKTVNLPELIFDNDNNCELEYGDSQRVTIHLEPADGSILIFAEVCDLADSTHQEELLERMMQANFFWMATDGFTLSLCKDDYRVVAMGQYDSEYFEDSEQLETCLTTCAVLARDWRQMVEEAELPSIEHGMPALNDTDKEETLNDDFQNHLWRFIRV